MQKAVRMDATRDVLIVGGGPTGMVAAMLLGDFGIDCLVVDKRAAIAALPRARGIHARATEILRQLGVEEDMVAAALPIRPQMEVRGPLDQPPEATIPTGGADFVEVSACEGIAIAQDLFERVLRDHLARRPNVELRLGTRATNLEVLSDGSVVVCLDDVVSGESDPVHAAYVVAADGWRSAIRRLAGIDFEGPNRWHRCAGCCSGPTCRRGSGIRPRRSSSSPMCRASCCPPTQTTGGERCASRDRPVWGRPMPHGSSTSSSGSM